MLRGKLTYKKSGTIQLLLSSIKRMVFSISESIGNSKNERSGNLPKSKLLLPTWKVQDNNQFAEGLNCDACKICINSCPTYCLSLQYDSEIVKNDIFIDPLGCIGCDLCVSLCPDEKLVMASVHAFAVAPSLAEPLGALEGHIVPSNFKDVGTLKIN